MPVLALFVVITITPLLPLNPYKAVAAPPLKIDMLSTSSGLISEIRLLMPLNAALPPSTTVLLSTITPSTTNKG